MSRSIKILLANAIALLILVVVLSNDRLGNLSARIQAERQAIAEIKSNLSLSPNRIARPKPSATSSQISPAAPVRKTTQNLKLAKTAIAKSRHSHSKVAATFGMVPDLLEILKNSNSKQVMTLAKSITAARPREMDISTNFAALFLQTFIAKNDPEYILRTPNLSKDWQLTSIALVALADKDLAAARSWMKSSNINDAQRTEIESKHLTRLLVNDPDASHTLLNELANTNLEIKSFFLSNPETILPEHSIETLWNTFDIEPNLQTKNLIASMLLRATAANGGPERTRATTRRIEESRGRVKEAQPRKL